MNSFDTVKGTAGTGKTNYLIDKACYYLSFSGKKVLFLSTEEDKLNIFTRCMERPISFWELEKMDISECHNCGDIIAVINYILNDRKYDAYFLDCNLSEGDVAKIKAHPDQDVTITTMMVKKSY